MGLESLSPVLVTLQVGREHCRNAVTKFKNADMESIVLRPDSDFSIGKSDSYESIMLFEDFLRPVRLCNASITNAELSLYYDTISQGNYDWNIPDRDLMFRRGDEDNSGESDTVADGYDGFEKAEARYVEELKKADPISFSVLGYLVVADDLTKIISYFGNLVGALT